MQQFANLLDCLTTTPSRNGKLGLLVEYFRTAPDPDRGFALAALTDGLFPRLPLRRALGELMADKIDPVLYQLSRDYVGDTAETVSLLWPDRRDKGPSPRLAEVVAALELAPRNNVAPDHRRLPRPPRRARALGAVEARRRRAARRRLGAPSQDGAGADERTRTLRHRGDVARAVAPRTRICSPGWRTAARAPAPKASRCSAL